MIWLLMNCSISNPILMDSVISLQISCNILWRTTAATATAEQVDAINKAAGPYGILSVILIIIAGALLYFFVLPRTLKGDQRKI